MTGSILVLGSTGTVGSGVVAHLVARGEPVIAAVLSSEPSSDSAIEQRHFDITDRDTWSPALVGVDRLFLMRPPALSDVAADLIPFADSAIAAGVRHVVFLSLQGAQYNFAAPHHLVEKHLKQVRAPFTFLRPNFFMQNLSGIYADDIRRTSRIMVPAGGSHTALIDTDDIGRVAAQVFSAPQDHIGHAYTLSGEESLDYREVAAVLTEVTGRTITYAQPSADEYSRYLDANGATAEYISVQRMIYRIVRLGLSSRPNRMVRELTGAPATTFGEFARRSRAAWV